MAAKYTRHCIKNHYATGQYTFWKIHTGKTQLQNVNVSKPKLARIQSGGQI